MAVMIVINKNAHLYLQTHLFAIGRAADDAEFRKNLRIMAAVLLADWSDSKPDLSGVRGNIFDVITNEQFYQTGVNKTSGERLWFCSYIGFEKITSKWAKENTNQSRGYICMRIYITDAQHNELESHTVQIYY